MSVNKLISVRTPIIDAQELLGIDHDKDIPFMTRLAVQAEKQIDSFYQYERTKALLDIKDCVACLPNDCIYVEVGLMGNHIENCDNLLQQWCGTSLNDVTNVNSNGLFLVVDVSGNQDGTFSFGQVPFSVQNNKLLFNRSMCGDQITIQYLRYKVDCDGVMEVCENHVEAIKWYIVWHYSLRLMSTNPKANYIGNNLMNLAMSEWNRNCRHARALDAELTPSERAGIVYNYHNPWSGRGMWQGMNTTLSLGNSYWIW